MPLSEASRVTATTHRGKMGQVVDERFLGSLAAELARTESGLEFVYRALERVTQALDIEDAVVVIDAEDAGRQIFRHGRRPVQGFPIGEVVEHAVAGLYTHPNAVPPDVADGVANLCAVALRLDMLRHDASRDPLTGLYNRRSFDAMLEQFVARSARYGWPFALGLLDLDGFKAVNDGLGHDGGDSVLRLIGSELRGSLRAGDFAARVGGDEFAVLMANGTTELVTTVVDRLSTAVNDALSDVAVGFSTGVAVGPVDGADAATLYRVADERLYRAKRQ
jgi:diguanylate cyclase (GGDEF)-like protein